MDRPPAPVEPHAEAETQNAAATVVPAPTITRKAPQQQSVTAAQRAEAFVRACNAIRSICRTYRVSHGLQMFSWVGNPDTGVGASFGTELVTPLVQAILLAEGLDGAMASTRTQLYAAARYPESQLLATALPQSSLIVLLRTLLKAAAIKAETSKSSTSFRAAHSWLPAGLQYSDISAGSASAGQGNLR